MFFLIIFSVADDRVIWGGRDSSRLLGEAMKEQAPSVPAVEAESEFVEGVVEMLVLDAALVSADHPPLEQRGDHVDARHDLVRRL